MKAGKWGGVLCLVLATVAVLGAVRAQPDQELLWTTDESPATPLGDAPLADEDARQALRDYFYGRYTEAACSAVYTDLTHDGRPELLVLELDADRAGEMLALHSGPVDPDRFTAAQVTVLRAGSDGAVAPIYQFTCGSAHAQWGELYLREWEGEAHLLWRSPYTADHRSNFQLALFSLGENGAVRDAERVGVSFALTPEAARPEDAGEAEIAAFEALSAELLEGAKPVIVYDVVHDRATGADGPRQFAYLDELFTDF